MNWTTPGIETTATQIDTNRQRNYSQSPHKNITQYSNSQSQNYTSSTPKHQRQTNQIQPTENTQPDPLAMDNIENSKLQFNHILCETTDDESETRISFE